MPNDPNSKVYVAGSINIDLVVRVAQRPRVGETVLGRSVDSYPGGKGANQAIAASRLGAPTVMLGTAGTDDFADRLLDYLSGSTGECGGGSSK